MSLYQTLCDLYKNDPKKSIQHSGYNHPQKAQAKWDLLLQAGSLKNFLEQSQYDLVHTNDSFVLKVCQQCMIDPLELIETVTALQKEHAILSELKTPYIFINTNFKRNNEPIFALACMEHTRRIGIDKKCLLETMDNGLATAILEIKKHMAKTLGNLPLWGKIINYQYVVNTKRYIINTEGEVINCVDDSKGLESHATLHLR